MTIHWQVNWCGCSVRLTVWGLLGLQHTCSKQCGICVLAKCPDGREYEPTGHIRSNGAFYPDVLCNYRVEKVVGVQCRVFVLAAAATHSGSAELGFLIMLKWRGWDWSAGNERRVFGTRDFQRCHILYIFTSAFTGVQQCLSKAFIIIPEKQPSEKCIKH